MRIIDLSVEYAPDVPCWWPTLDPFEATPTLTLEEDRIFSRQLRIEEHSGTHMDAPGHISTADGAAVSARTLQDVALSDLIGRARIIDVSAVRGDVDGESAWIGVDVLETFEARTEPVVDGDVVLLASGWSDERYLPFPEGDAYTAAALDGSEPGWPAPSAELIHALADRGVRAVGVDVPTLGGLQDLFSAHLAAFERGITPIENLTKLRDIPDAKATFVFLPLRIRNGSGSPGRAVAILDGALGGTRA